MFSSATVARAWAGAKWRERFGFRQPEVGDWPVVDEREVTARFELYNALGLTLERARELAREEMAGMTARYSGFSFGLSSGTTGEPGVFLTSEAERARWFGTVLARLVSLRELAGARVALLLKHHNRLYADAGGRLRYFDLARADEVNQFAPQIVVGPPSILLRVAPTFRPRVVITGAEPLFPQDRVGIERAYGVKPRQIYQAKEGFLGFECRSGRVHLNEDLIRFEWEKIERDRAVPVITDFTRTSQAYRRYRVGDVLIADGVRCGCGSRLGSVATVEGRLQDVMVTRSRLYFPLELNAILAAWEPYCLRQFSIDRFELAAAGVPVGLRDRLEGARIDLVPFEQNEVGRKRRRFQRLFDPYSESILRNVSAGR